MTTIEELINTIMPLAHDTCKLKRYYDLVGGLPAEPIIERIIPLFLMDDELSDFIDLLEELKEQIELTPTPTPTTAMQPIKEIGEFAHDTCKLKRYYDLLEELPVEPIIDRILPMFLTDDELSDFIDLLEELKEQIAQELADKQTKSN